LVLDVVVNKSDDGVTAEIPSVKGCEVWAHDEDTALEKIIELAVYYLKLESNEKPKLDRARTTKTQIIYKLVFTKS
jgi:hypothetical protein